MSSLSAAIGYFADEMSDYRRSISTWFNVACQYLENVGLSKQRNEILGIKPGLSTGVVAISPAGIWLPGNDMAIQFRMLRLAMQNQCVLKFDDGKDANGWLSYFMQSHEDRFEA